MRCWYDFFWSLSCPMRNIIKKLNVSVSELYVLPRETWRLFYWKSVGSLWAAENWSGRTRRPHGAGKGLSPMRSFHMWSCCCSNKWRITLCGWKCPPPLQCHPNPWNLWMSPYKAKETAQMWLSTLEMEEIILDYLRGLTWSQYFLYE